MGRAADGEVLHQRPGEAGARMAGRLLSRWRTQIFILMSNNALDATEFFRIPPNGVAESGAERPVVRQRRGV
jgi:hypothetical protein